MLNFETPEKVFASPAFSSTEFKSQMSRSSRITIAAGCACLIVITLLVFSSKKPAAAVIDFAKTEEARKPLPASPRATSRQEASGSDRSRVTAPPSSKSFNQIDSILADQSVDDAATAIKLIDLAGRSDVSIEERMEALSHAVLLTPDSEGPRLVALAQERSLAPELGEILLSDFHNRQDPTRLAGAVALTKNNDHSIQTQAMELVRFLMGEGEDGGSDSEALQKAEIRLKK